MCLSAEILSSTCFYFKVPSRACDMIHILGIQQIVVRWLLHLPKREVILPNIISVHNGHLNHLCTHKQFSSDICWTSPDKNRQVAGTCYAPQRLAFISTLFKQPPHTLENNQSMCQADQVCVSELPKNNNISTWNPTGRLGNPVAVLQLPAKKWGSAGVYPGCKGQLLKTYFSYSFQSSTTKKDFVLMPESSEHGHCWFP